eukprot:CAMPEP_0170390550 /NCGR_PEP_ID=MMETSP0117_2-20130122/19209_1 /TAXON_ID=400756 /ORGANISM="Durinskia baltica, Strain CSIRO CS-38" /LENGTH=92 /DNA_ID=CAMNT_0010646609 /DNA_START=430 /DNA_END=704 /DNA_ORIENTATION=+
MQGLRSLQPHQGRCAVVVPVPSVLLQPQQSRGVVAEAVIEVLRCHRRRRPGAGREREGGRHEHVAPWTCLAATGVFRRRDEWVTLLHRAQSR